MSFDNKRKKIAFHSREIIEKLSIDEDKNLPEIRKYTDIKGTKVDIFQIKNIIEKGLNIFITVGVSEHKLQMLSRGDIFRCYRTILSKYRYETYIIYKFTSIYE